MIRPTNLSQYTVRLLQLALLVSVTQAAAPAATAAEPARNPSDGRPNILFAIADDWGWPHAGAYGDEVVQTPTFDRIAREGALFQQAYVTSPSCTPSRNSILTGQWHWRLGVGANLWSAFPDRFSTFPERFQKAGYQIGYRHKAYGPGPTETKGRKLVGPEYAGFDEFFDQRDSGKPFCFWLGSRDPHRDYELGSGAKSGMDLSKIKPAACFPDSPEVRSDIADYYWEVQRFDRLVGEAVRKLEAAGLLDNTIVIVTGDHGMPFPRCKSHLYDSGTRVPLAMRWPQGAVRAGQQVKEFVSLVEIAATLFDATQIEPGKPLDGGSWMPLVSDSYQEEGESAATVDRSLVIFGKERHVPSQESPDRGGYPCRGLRTQDFLLIKNHSPDRWPSGSPAYDKNFFPGAWYADTDNGPTKTYMIENRDRDSLHRKLFDLSFAKRPAIELYDLRADPGQLENVAESPEYREMKASLLTKLHQELSQAGDPRQEGLDPFTAAPYYGQSPRHPTRSEEPLPKSPL